MASVIPITINQGSVPVSMIVEKERIVFRLNVAKGDPREQEVLKTFAEIASQLTATYGLRTECHYRQQSASADAIDVVTIRF